MTHLHMHDWCRDQNKKLFNEALKPTIFFFFPLNGIWLGRELIFPDRKFVKGYQVRLFGILK